MPPARGGQLLPCDSWCQVGIVVFLPRGYPPYVCMCIYRKQCEVAMNRSIPSVLELRVYGREFWVLLCLFVSWTWGGGVFVTVMLITKCVSVSRWCQLAVAWLALGGSCLPSAVLF